jgi:hypothetical protein
MPLIFRIWIVIYNSYVRLYFACKSRVYYARKRNRRCWLNENTNTFLCIEWYLIYNLVLVSRALRSVLYKRCFSPVHFRNTQAIVFPYTYRMHKRCRLIFYHPTTMIMTVVTVTYTIVYRSLRGVNRTFGSDRITAIFCGIIYG